jgi:hypothetical protein
MPLVKIQARIAQSGLPTQLHTRTCKTDFNVVFHRRIVLSRLLRVPSTEIRYVLLITLFPCKYLYLLMLFICLSCFSSIFQPPKGASPKFSSACARVLLIHQETDLRIFIVHESSLDKQHHNQRRFYSSG